MVFAMQKISSSHYPLTRLLLPHLSVLRRRGVQLAIAALVLLSVLTGLWPLLLLLLLPMGLLLAVHHAPNIVYQNFCRDAWLGDEEFVLQLKDQTIQIPFAQVQAITWHGSNNPPRARIVLKSTGPYGQVFTFIPDLTHGRSGAKALVESLQPNQS